MPMVFEDRSLGRRSGSGELELRVDGLRAGASKNALSDIPVNSPTSKKLYSQKQAGSGGIFRSWRDSASNQVEKRSSSASSASQGRTGIDVSASLDSWYLARQSRASSSGRDAAREDPLRRSTGSSPVTRTEAATTQRPKWWQNLRPEDLVSPAEPSADDSPPPAQAASGGPAGALAERTHEGGAREGERPSAAPTRAESPPSPASKRDGASEPPGTPPGGSPRKRRAGPHVGVLQLNPAASPVKAGTVPDDVWEESEWVVADFFGATDSEDEYGATESCMRLLIHSRHMHSASATASCASPVASECASVSRRADSQSAANSAAPSSRAASGSLLSQHHRQAAGYATAYRELRERGAMRSEGSGGVKPVSANGPVRTVTVAGIPFGLREEFLARPAVATMTLQEIQAEKHELKVELKGVDRQFMAKVGRKATKAEKESLRPWYVRYWRLKHALTKQAGGSGQDEEDEM